MRILVLNSGSSSIKFQLFEMQTKTSLASGLVEQIGSSSSRAVLKANGEVYEIKRFIKDHHDGLEAMNELFTTSHTLHDLSELDGIGHRIVHGGESFFSSMIVDESVIKKCQSTPTATPYPTTFARPITSENTAFTALHTDMSASKRQKCLA